MFMLIAINIKQNPCLCGNCNTILFPISKLSINFENNN